MVELYWEYTRDMASAKILLIPAMCSTVIPTGLLIIMRHKIRWRAFPLMVFIAVFLIQDFEVVLSVQFSNVEKLCLHNSGCVWNNTVIAA